jgi:hypothetical protein
MLKIEPMKLEGNYVLLRPSQPILHPAVNSTKPPGQTLGGAQSHHLHLG